MDIELMLELVEKIERLNDCLKNTAEQDFIMMNALSEEHTILKISDVKEFLLSNVSSFIEIQYAVNEILNMLSQTVRE